MKTISNRHWIVVTPVAVLAHLGIAAVMLSAPAPSGAKAPGTGGIEISLGAAGGAPGEAAAAAPTDAPTEPPTETVAAVPVALPVAAPPVVESPPEVVAPPVADTIQPIEAPVPVQVAAVQAQAVIPPPRPKRKPDLVKPVAVTPVVVTPPQEAPVVEEPRPVEPVENLQPASRPMDDAEQIAALPPVTAGAGGRSGARNTADAGDGAAAAPAAGGVAGEAADYMAHLQVWLQEHKEYPRSARRRRQEGMALLAFVMDRNGYVLEHSLRQSSGHKMLDNEVLALIRRAEPLPPPPPEVAGERIRLVVPVQFFLR